VERVEVTALIYLAAFVILLPVLYIVSVPIHEICHLLTAKAMGCQNELKVNLLGVWPKDGETVIGGYVFRKDESEPWSFTPPFHMNHKTGVFLFGLSGGLGASLIMSLGFLLLFIAPQIGAIVPPLAVLVGGHAVYGVIEGLNSIKKGSEFLNEEEA